MADTTIRDSRRADVPGVSIVVAVALVLAGFIAVRQFVGDGIRAPGEPAVARRVDPRDTLAPQTSLPSTTAPAR